MCRTRATASACSYRTPTTCPLPRVYPSPPEPGQHPLGGRRMARLEAGSQVFGEGGVGERAAIEPVPEAAERALVGATGVHADRSGDELGQALSRPAGRERPSMCLSSADPIVSGGSD